MEPEACQKAWHLRENSGARQCLQKNVQKKVFSIERKPFPYSLNPCMVKNIANWWEVLNYLKTLPVWLVRRILLWGIPGSGKTTYAFNLKPDSEMETVTKGMFQDAIFGKFLLKDGSTFWSDNFVTRAARKDTTAIINELNEAGAELDAPLNKALDDASICRFNLDSGEVVIP